jgi:hypothetical protein
MALAHNAFVRILNSIYLQAEQVKKPQDIADFYVYCQTFNTVVSRHHHHEEEIFFPQIEEYSGVKGIMEVNVQQHEAFEGGLQKFAAYVNDTPVDKYDGNQLKLILDEFGAPFCHHLKEEIGTLLGLEKYDHETLYKVTNKFEDRIVATSDKVRLYLLFSLE